MNKNILLEICDKKRLHVDEMRTQASLDDVKERMKGVAPARGFLNALKLKAEQNKPALIAEVKKASPSKGVIRADFDPISIAKSYEEAGAACISVLTDIPYFQGNDDYLRAVKGATTLPVLRKDFMVDPYQIYESRMLGADCILLIMAALNDDEYRRLYELSKHLGMDVLVEVHDKEELDRALVISPDLVGVNNRNLKTLQVDIQTSYELLSSMPGDTICVAESGIGSHEVLKSLHDAGYSAFLVGESLMRQDDVTLATRTLLGDK